MEPPIQTKRKVTIHMQLSIHGMVEVTVDEKPDGIGLNGNILKSGEYCSAAILEAGTDKLTEEQTKTLQHFVATVLTGEMFKRLQTTNGQVAREEMPNTNLFGETGGVKG